MQAASIQDQVKLTEDFEKQQINEITKHLSEATQSNVQPHQVIPIKNQNPLPQFSPVQGALVEHPIVDDSKSQPDPEILDLMEGLQGKPRTAHAVDFLKDKLAWLKKKHGTEVTLKK